MYFSIELQGGLLPPPDVIKCNTGKNYKAKLDRINVLQLLGEGESCSSRL